MRTCINYLSVTENCDEISLLTQSVKILRKISTSRGIFFFLRIMKIHCTVKCISKKNDAILNSEGQGIVRSVMHTKSIQIALLRESNIRF